MFQRDRSSTSVLTHRLYCSCSNIQAESQQVEEKVELIQECCQSITILRAGNKACSVQKISITNLCETFLLYASLCLMLQKNNCMCVALKLLCCELIMFLETGKMFCLFPFAIALVTAKGQQCLLAWEMMAHG